MKTLSLEDIKDIEKVKEDYLFIDNNGDKIYSEVNAQKINAYNKMLSSDAVDVAQNITFNSDGEVGSVGNGVKSISVDRLFLNKCYTKEEKGDGEKAKPIKKLVVVAGMFSSENYLSIKASSGMIPYKVLTAHTLVNNGKELVVEKVEQITDEEFNNKFKETLSHEAMAKVINAIIGSKKIETEKSLKDLGL